MSRTNEKRTDGNDEPVCHAKVWRTTARTIHDQQLMLEQGGLSDNGPDTGSTRKTSEHGENVGN